MPRAKFNLDNIHPVDLRLLDGQVEIVLNALLLYSYNLEYMLDTENFKHDADEISRKTAKVRYTYEQIASARAQQLRNREGSSYLGINKTENKVLNLIKGNKFITQPEIAKILNLSENCVYRNIKSLRDKNIIIRIGANKNGCWELRDNFIDKCKDNGIDFDSLLNA